MQQQYTILFIIFIIFFVTIMAANIMALFWQLLLNWKLWRVTKRKARRSTNQIPLEQPALQWASTAIQGVPGTSNRRSHLYGP